MCKVLGAAIALALAVVPCRADGVPPAPSTTPTPPTTTPTSPPDGKDKPHSIYDDLYMTLSEKPKYDIDNTKCNVAATIDYDIFYHNMSTFRKAWLNEDYSLEDNLHHSRQILTLIIMRHLGAIMTYATYNDADPKPSTDCHFTAGITYTDKYGQQQSFNAIHWDFTNELAAKINWQKFDESKFNEIADNWSYTKGTDDFNQLEEPLSQDGKYHPLHQEEEAQDFGKKLVISPDGACTVFLFNMNAMFIRSTTYCRQDFMDTRAGNIALESARACAKINSETALKDVASEAMKKLDALVRQSGRRGVCAVLAEMQRDIVRGKR